MKKKILICLLSGCLTACTVGSATVYADGRKVVTLGYDLTEDQKTAILKYFGVLGENVETMYITNQDERDHLLSYVPEEQIGTHTYSCALVKPTTYGGIQVKTANLTWVTSNMIASTLSTAGVVNCEVLAASPFEVSGTGALTGVLMAYETASGQTLDAEKKDIATQELVTTGQIASSLAENGESETISQAQATNIVNEIKMQVIQGQVVDTDEVADIVEDVIDSAPITVSLSDEDKAMIQELADQIAAQQYNYDDMKETLERVEENVSVITDSVSEIQSNVEQSVEDLAAAAQASSSQTASEQSSGTQAAGTDNASSQTASSAETETTQTEEKLPEDSILLQTDDSALGDSVIIDATNSEAVASAETELSTENTASDNSAGFEITTSDEASVGSTSDSDTYVSTEAASSVADESAENSESASADEITIEDAQSGDSAQIDQSSEEQSVEDQSMEDQYAEEQSVEDQYSEEQSVEDQSMEDQYAEEQSVEDQYAEDQSMEDQYAEEQSVEDQYAEEQSVVDQYSEEQSVEDQYAEDQSMEDQYAEEQSVEDQYAEDQSMEDQYAEDQSMEDQYAEDQFVDEGYSEDQSSDEEIAEEQDVPQLVTGDSILISVSSDNTDQAAGTGIVGLLISTPDLTLISGNLVVTDDFGNETARIDLSQTQNVAAVSIPDELLNQYGWTEGSLFLINLGTNLEQNLNYTVAFENAVVASNSDASLQAALELTSTLSGNNSYGLSVSTQALTDLSTGNTLSSVIFSDGSAASAAITDYSTDLIAVDATEFDLSAGSSALNITLNQSGYAYITMDFYDIDGNYLDTVTEHLFVLS